MDVNLKYAFSYMFCIKRFPSIDITKRTDKICHLKAWFAFFYGFCCHNESENYATESEVDCLEDDQTRKGKFVCFNYGAKNQDFPKV